MKQEDLDAAWARLKPVAEAFAEWMQSLEKPSATPPRLKGRKGLLKCPKCAFDGDLPAMGVLGMGDSTRPGQGAGPGLNKARCRCPSCGEDWSGSSGRKKNARGRR